ncbi:GlsB/YeaQ/YmgE family stress response membrane protein [Pseudonocardia sp. RS11V-5]|uniref:GlsB/YeaQ/YmgE family stress response membrane protein n=1 Tax=Pseudonocardia terrae TaxID=2905831 RepID=UPI001E38CA47|nr:GlsB/YeaQ/YmgE family stress response membrane protein [Pseudonocardia terrae]MCE3550407.1 GlsB/YeaQ/YmgE family stress response membrane protein [Pseudonocardia terrae]
MTITGIISAIIIGLIIGAVARLLVPGKQNIPIWLTLVIGLVGAFVGSAIARAFHVVNTSGIDWIEIILQIVVAVILVVIVSGLWARRGARH